MCYFDSICFLYYLLVSLVSHEYCDFVLLHVATGSFFIAHIFF